MTSTLQSPRSAGARQLVVGKHAALDAAPEPAFWGYPGPVVEPRTFRLARIPPMRSLGCDVWMKESSSS